MKWEPRSMSWSRASTISKLRWAPPTYLSRSPMRQSLPTPHNSCVGKRLGSKDMVAIWQKFTAFMCIWWCIPMDHSSCTTVCATYRCRWSFSSPEPRHHYQLIGCFPMIILVLLVCLFKVVDARARRCLDNFYGSGPIGLFPYDHSRTVGLSV